MLNVPPIKSQGRGKLVPDFVDAVARLAKSIFPIATAPSNFKETDK